MGTSDIVSFVMLGFAAVTAGITSGAALAAMALGRQLHMDERDHACCDAAFDDWRTTHHLQPLKI